MDPSEIFCGQSLAKGNGPDHIFDRENFSEACSGGGLVLILTQNFYST